MSVSSEKTQASDGSGSRLATVLDLAPTPVAADTGAAMVTVIRVAILAALFTALHWRLLDWLVRSWWYNNNWSHGFLIPLFSLYLVYSRRQEVRQARRRVYWPALVLMVFFALLEVAIMGIPGVRSYWLLGGAMVGMLFALVLYLGGPRLAYLLWLPVFYLLLSLPVTTSLYVRIAYPLQEFAAAGAVKALQMFGVQITRAASHLTLTSQSLQQHELTVAEACSGMRLLMAFFALGVATAYLETRPVWQRIVLVGAALPIAILCNVLRVAITCTMFYIDRPELGKGVLHNFTGMLMLIPAFGMLWALGWLISRLFIEVEDDEDDEDAHASGPTPGSATAEETAHGR